MLNLGMLNNHESNTSVIKSLEVIDEREEKQEKKTITEVTDRNISSHIDPKNVSSKFLKQHQTQEMVDIANI